MPLIQGADLSTVSTKYEPLPAGAYKTRLKAAYETDDDGVSRPRVVVRHKVLESFDGENVGREFTDFMYLNQNDGKPNEISLKQLKRYFEAVLGEEAANTTAPETELLDDQEVSVELSIESYPSKKEKNEDNTPKIMYNNRVKRIVAA